jgi:hypothetical protein
MSLIKATALREIYAAFDAAPMSRADVGTEFYVGEVNTTRGGDRIQHLQLSLDRAHGTKHFKAFVMGHAGVGISTELTRLEAAVSSKFRILRLSANTDFDPVNFRPFDFLLRVALGLATATALPVNEGGADAKLSADLTKDILDWFAVEKSIVKTGYDVSLSASAGIGPGPESWWAKLLGLFAKVSAEAKTSSGRSKELIEYREKNGAQLLALANKVLDECNALLRDASGHEWLIIGDDFDKPGIPPERLRDFFSTYGNLIRDLHVHLILDLPVSLGHSTTSNYLPPNFGTPLNFPDTPVYTRDHNIHPAGRSAIHRIIETRADTVLFADGQIDRLIVASGGNIRDLFGLIIEAATRAELRRSEPRVITAEDIDPAIALFRKKYRDQLGSTPYDVEKVAVEDKVKKLIAIYIGAPGSNVPDPALYSLLHARAVQEFNGDYWYGIHPLTVDFLEDFKGHLDLEKVRNPITKRLPGGTI